MSTEGPGGVPPKPQWKRSASEAESGRDEPESGNTRDGRTASGVEDTPRPSRSKKRKIDGPALTLSNLKPLDLRDLNPVTGVMPGLAISPLRRQSSPGRLSSPVKTPVNDEIKVLWQRLELQQSATTKCNDESACAFKFNADEIVASTVVRTPDNKLTPYNRITLDGVYVGIAARGPKTSEQAEVLFNTALEENCNAIVNLTTQMEGMVDDYLPDPGNTSSFGQVVVGRNNPGEIVQDDSASLFFLKPVNTKIQVKSGDNYRELVFHWEQRMFNHVSAAPEILLGVSHSLPDGPALIHCQKGVGRTAMVMLVHAMVSKKYHGLTKEQAIPSLMKMIEDGRSCRGEFLENDQQLQSVLKTVALLFDMTNEELTAAVTLACS